MTPKEKYEERKAARKARDGSVSAQNELEVMDDVGRKKVQTLVCDQIGTRRVKIGDCKWRDILLTHVGIDNEIAFSQSRGLAFF